MHNNEAHGGGKWRRKISTFFFQYHDSNKNKEMEEKELKRVEGEDEWRGDMVYIYNFWNASCRHYLNDFFS